MSGYCDCSCRDCFEIAVSNDDGTPAFCNACEAAGCDTDSECQVVEDDPEGVLDRLGNWS